MDAIELRTKTDVSASREMDGKSSLDREERDRALLLRLGKRPVLKRTYGFMAILGFTTTILVTWEGVLLVFNIGLVNGGPAGMIYMYIFAWLGWQALVASTGYIAGTLIQTLVVITIPSYEATSWQEVLIIYTVLLFGFTINTVAHRLLPTLEGPVLCIHILAFFGVLVPLINGALGLGILLTALYATTNIEDTLSSQAGEARYPFLYILQNGIGSLGGAIAMGAIITVMQTFGISLIWRLPHLDSRTSLPVRCILFTVTMSALLCLISIGSTTAFNDIVALVTSDYYPSYLMASGVLLHRRLTGAIVAPGIEDSPYEPVNNIG
ncbi:Amino acid/polyamine transporter I [Penicillium occitanis (nom. inval.)]|nr:Amino acid/polyamine transporter I [Penicillium occitanis (nom. inval.)]PCG91698.1 hypothetical protein PENOC_096040 [Penicillium occitanis (nom. inval.)]